MCPQSASLLMTKKLAPLSSVMPQPQQPQSAGPYLALEFQFPGPIFKFPDRVREGIPKLMVSLRCWLNWVNKKVDLLAALQVWSVTWAWGGTGHTSRQPH